MGDAFEICVIKGSELPDDPIYWEKGLKKYKGRVVFRGNNVKDENADFAIFQDHRFDLSSGHLGSRGSH